MTKRAPCTRTATSVDANDVCEGAAHTKFCTLNLGTMEKRDEIQLAKIFLHLENLQLNKQSKQYHLKR